MRLSRLLMTAGLAAMLIGALDPLEGAVVILPGAVLAAWEAWRAHDAQRRLLFWAAALITLGVAAMFILSAFGGVGGSTGRSMWWLWLVAPYPVGWLIGIIVLVRILLRRGPLPS